MKTLFGVLVHVTFCIDERKEWVKLCMSFGYLL